MKQNWTIGKRIYGLTGFLVLMIAVISGYALLRINIINNYSDSIASDNMPGLASSARLNTLRADVQIRVLRLLRANTPEDRKAIRDEIHVMTTAINESLEEYDKTIHFEDDRQLFNVLKNCRDEYLKIREQFYATVETNNTEAAKLADGVLKTVFNAYNKAGDDLMNYNAKMGLQQSALLDVQVHRARYFLVIISVIALVIGVVVSIFLVRRTNAILSDVVSSVSDGSDQIASASNQVSSSSQSLAEGASQQAASLEETSSSLEEMSSMAKQNADNAVKAGELSKQANQAADRGLSDMNSMAQAMQGIQESSGQIAKIIKTIDEIAFQTNILALNAAVEAARAG
jgi:methyl-accepting chemotaxis protein